jgi:hypothetical protein
MVSRCVVVLVVLALPLWGCELLVDDGERVLATPEAGSRDGAGMCQDQCSLTDAGCGGECD